MVDGSCKFVVFSSVLLSPSRRLGVTVLDAFGDLRFFLVEKRPAESTPLLSLSGLIFGDNLEPGRM